MPARWVSGPRLLPFMPLPVVARSGEGESARYRWLGEQDLPQSIGRLTGFNGNAGVLLRAYVYMRMLGREGMSRVGDFATLNSNYLLARLQQAGYVAAYPRRRASHEFILTLKLLAQQQHVTAMDVAKRLLDFGFHAPTTYFPLLVPECLLIEPTETESKETLDAFVGRHDGDSARGGQGSGDSARPRRIACRCAASTTCARRANSIWRTSRAPPDGSRHLIARDKPRGFTRLFRAFGASRKGLIGAFREEAAFRQELALAVVRRAAGIVARAQWRGARAAGGAGVAGADRRTCSTAPSRRPWTGSVRSATNWPDWPRTSAPPRCC